MVLTRLLFIFHVSEIDKTHPAFFGIIILISIQNIDLFCQRIIQKPIPVIVHFCRARIAVQKQTTTPFIRQRFVKMRVQFKP